MHTTTNERLRMKAQAQQDAAHKIPRWKFLLLCAVGIPTALIFFWATCWVLYAISI